DVVDIDKGGAAAGGKGSILEGKSLDAAVIEEHPHTHGAVVVDDGIEEPAEILMVRVGRNDGSVVASKDAYGLIRAGAKESDPAGGVAGSGAQPREVGIRDCIDQG